MGACSSAMQSCLSLWSGSRHNYVVLGNGEMVQDTGYVMTQREKDRQDHLRQIFTELEREKQNYTVAVEDLQKKHQSLATAFAKCQKLLKESQQVPPVLAADLDTKYLEFQMAAVKEKRAHGIYSRWHKSYLRKKCEYSLEDEKLTEQKRRRILQQRPGYQDTDATLQELDDIDDEQLEEDDDMDDLLKQINRPRALGTIHMGTGTEDMMSGDTGGQELFDVVARLLGRHSENMEGPESASQGLDMSRFPLAPIDPLSMETTPTEPSTVTSPRGLAEAEVDLFA